MELVVFYPSCELGSDPAILRRACVMKKRTYSVLKVSVCTVKKSAAQSCGRWLARKLRQDWDGGHRSALRR